MTTNTNTNTSNNILLNTNIIQDTKLSDMAIATYVALKILQNKKNKLVVSTNSIAYFLFGCVCTDRKFLSNIHNGIQELINNNYISLIEKITSSEYVLDSENITTNASNIKSCFYVSENDINTIMNIKIINIKLLRYYLVAISSIDNKTKIGNLTQVELCEKSNLGKNTILKYNKILQELGLISVQFNKVSNIYSKIEKGC